MTVTVALGFGGAKLETEFTHHPPKPENGPARSGGKARAEDDFGKVKVKLDVEGYKPDLDFDNTSDCAAHSYGALVPKFLAANRCISVSRAGIVLHDPLGHVTLVAITRVEMPNRSLAERLKSCLDTPNTGNVAELTRERGAYMAYKFNGDGYTSAIDGVDVRNTQIRPVEWTPSAAAMRAMLIAVSGRGTTTPPGHSSCSP